MLSVMFFLLASATALDDERLALRYSAPLGVHLLDTPMEEIQRRFGSATLSVEGHHEGVACYLWPHTKVKFIVGDEGIGAGFEMYEATAPLPPSCVAVSKDIGSKGHIEVNSLRLGMREDEFVRKLKPIEVEDGWKEIRFSWTKEVCNKRGACGLIYYEVQVDGKFANGRLVGLKIWKTGST